MLGCCYVLVSGLVVAAVLGHVHSILSNANINLCDLDPCTCPGDRGRVVCDCSTSETKDVNLRTIDRAHLFINFGSITINNCSRVHVERKALVSFSALRQITFINIKNLILESNAFNWLTDDQNSHNGVTINITNVFISEIPSYTFEGTLHKIILQNVTVRNIRSFAFASLTHTDIMEFRDCTFLSIDAQAFKRFSTNYVMIIGTNFSSDLVTRTMVDIEVKHDLKFQNVKFNSIQSSALKIRGPQRFTILDCKIDFISSKAFDIAMRGDVNIQDNTFMNIITSAFSEITIERKYFQEFGKQKISFKNNTINLFETNSLAFNTTNFHPIIDSLLIDRSCSCPETAAWLTDLYPSNSHNPNKNYDLSGDIFCKNVGSVRSIKNFQKLFCGGKTTSLYIIVALVVGTLVTLLVIGVIIFFGYRRTVKRYINVPTSPSLKIPADPGKGLMMVVPEGRTYRETELHVIVEHAEPITPMEYVGNVVN